MRTKFTVGSAMVGVAAVGVGFSALRSASALWACALFTSAFLATTYAAVAAVATRGRARSATAGFAIACGAYLATAFVFLKDGNGVMTTPFPTAPLIARYTAPPGGAPRVGPLVEDILDDHSAFWIYGPPAPTLQPGLPQGEFPVHLVRIAHSLVSLVLGLAGAGLGLILSRLGASQADDRSLPVKGGL